MSIEHLTYRDPEAGTADDYLSDLESAITCEIARHSKGRPGFKLVRQSCEAERVETSPECFRKSVVLSMTFEIQVDGENFEANVEEVRDEMAKVFAMR